MNFKTIAFAALGLALATPSIGSYELLCVLDGTSKSIHRYDTVTGTYLGSIGGGWLNSPGSMIIDPATRVAHVFDTFGGGSGQQGILSFNIDTGEKLSIYPNKFTTISGPITMALKASGRIVVAGTSNIQDQETSGLLFGPISPGYDPGGLAFGPDNFIYIADSTNERIIRANSSNYSTALASAPTTLFGDGQMVFNGTRGYFATGFGRVMSFDSTTLAGITQINLSNLSTTRGIAFGHGLDMFVTGLNAAGTAGLVQRYDAKLGAVGGTFGGAELKNPLAAGTLIAPEPGSLLALGVGLVAILRRRRG